jgi:hypothetical protein
MQGLAGALINSVVQLGIAVLLGASDVLAGATRHKGAKQSYKIVFWFELALAALALVILVGFVRLKKAKSALTADELEELRRNATAAN